MHGLIHSGAGFKGFSRVSRHLQSGFCFAGGLARQVGGCNTGFKGALTTFVSVVDAVLRSWSSARPESKIFFRRGRR
jgi:hypothetical protein